MIAIAVLLLCLTVSGSHAITFDLSDYDPSNSSTDVRKLFINLTRELLEIEVTNIPDTVGFYILQVHSNPSNVSLSSSRKMKRQKTIQGTNIGLVALSEYKDMTFYLKSKNNSNALIVIIIYQITDPIPGGCNLTFDTENAPYQLVSYSDDMIIVQSQPPSALGTSCDKNDIQVDLYHLYLPENNYDQSHYFKGLEKMLTVDTIKANGYKVSAQDGYYKYNKLYSRYTGLGQIFSIVATYRNKSSAYVPAVSYGCDLNNEEESCNGPITPHWKIICAALLIFGIFTCFHGHKFFRFTQYIMGFTVGVFLTYVILSFNNNLTVGEKTTTSLIIGLIYGSVWLLIWWKFGIPILSVSFTFFMSGFVIASVIFYAGVADLSVFHHDINFWLTFFSIIVSLQALWTMFTLEGHIFGCSFVGAYATVAALNYYIGGNLQYIVINSFRRMTVKNFNMATIDPPFQIIDIAQSLLLVVMTASGFYYQMREQRGKPPFPPHRYTTVEEGVTERTPLLQNNAIFYSDI